MKVLVFLLMSLVCHSVSLNAEEYSLRSGIITGQMKKLGVSGEGESDTFEFGGIPLGLSAERGINSATSCDYGLFLNYDPLAKQIVRSGLELGWHWYLMGGPSRLTLIDGAAIAKNQYGLSFMSHISYSRVSAIASGEDPIKVSGTMLDISSGFRFRWQLLKHNALAVELRTPVLLLPSSSDRVEFKYSEYSFSWGRLF